MPDVSAEIKELEDHFDDDTESIITNERYVYISSIIGECLTKAKKGEKLSTSDKIDRFVTNRFLHFRFLHWLCLSYIMYLSQQLVDSLPIGQMIHCLASGLFREQEPYLRTFTVPAG